MSPQTDPEIEADRACRILQGVAASPSLRRVFYGSGTIAAGTRLASHPHRHCRFLFARKGSMRIEAVTASLFVPTHFGVWIPPDVEYTLEVTETVTLDFLYVAEGELGDCPDSELSVVEVGDFTAAFIQHVCTAVPPDHLEESSAARLIRALIELLGEMPDGRLKIPLPPNPRLAAMCRSIQADPGAAHRLEVWAAKLGMSQRTLARHFVAETGMTYQSWRQNLRLIASLSLLRGGLSVTTTALEIGYSTPSAFIVAFKKKFGLPPSRYVWL
jgi:AraC-like DNA-binding protein